MIKYVNIILAPYYTKVMRGLANHDLICQYKSYACDVGKTHGIGRKRHI